MFSRCPPHTHPSARTAAGVQSDPGVCACARARARARAPARASRPTVSSHTRVHAARVALCLRCSVGSTAHVLTAADYQSLMDLGWRRSGTWCYTIANQACCCPTQTIRLRALEFEPSKAQVRVIHRLRRYLAGEATPHPAAAPSAAASQQQHASKRCSHARSTAAEGATRQQLDVLSEVVHTAVQRLPTMFPETWSGDAAMAGLRAFCVSPPAQARVETVVLPKRGSGGSKASGMAGHNCTGITQSDATLCSGETSGRSMCAGTVRVTHTSSVAFALRAALLRTHTTAVRVDTTHAVPTPCADVVSVADLASQIAAAVHAVIADTMPPPIASLVAESSAWGHVNLSATWCADAVGDADMSAASTAQVGGNASPAPHATAGAGFDAGAPLAAPPTATVHNFVQREHGEGGSGSKSMEPHPRASVGPSSKGESATAPSSIPSPAQPVDAARARTLRLSVTPSVYDDEAFALYKKYQMTVHGDAADKVTPAGFARFLCKSPIIAQPGFHPLSTPATVQQSGVREPRHVTAFVQGLYNAELAAEAAALDDGASDVVPEATTTAAAGAGGAHDSAADPVWMQSLCEVVDMDAFTRAGFGSFHVKYYLDDALVAVAVTDITPRCLVCYTPTYHACTICCMPLHATACLWMRACALPGAPSLMQSSVYVLYDPDYAHLSLGKLTALVDIAAVRRLASKLPRLRYYYLGYYIHRCPKMRYKAEYQPSDLLVSGLTDTWLPYAFAVAQLEAPDFAGALRTPHDAAATRALADARRALLPGLRAWLEEAHILLRPRPRRRGSEDGDLRAPPARLVRGRGRDMLAQLVRVQDLVPRSQTMLASLFADAVSTLDVPLLRRVVWEA
ncbi:hypothetical protein EON67_00040 [archaeon]|nr:MAG: hypothetical protein EON67_00040 [archaeon]